MRIHTNSTSIVAVTSTISLCNTMMIVKVFIFIFNNHFLENLMPGCTLTRCHLVLIDFLCSSFFLNSFRVGSSLIELAIHHGMVHYLITQAITHPIQVDPVRVLIFKGAQAATGTFA
jgi:hypothetical protein